MREHRIKLNCKINKNHFLLINDVLSFDKYIRCAYFFECSACKINKKPSNNDCDTSKFIVFFTMHWNYLF